MTRPMGEPSPGRRAAALQAATRQLQRRPAPTPGSGRSWAVASYGEASHTADGSDRIRFHFNTLETNDTDLFELNDISSDTIAGSGQWAKNLAINEGGYYMMWCDAFSNIPNQFNTFNTYIEPIYVSGSTDTLLSTSDFKGNVVEARTARSQLQATSEWNHDGMHRMVSFWHDPTFNSEDPLRVALRVVTAKDAAVNIGGRIVVVQFVGIEPDVTVTFL